MSEARKCVTFIQWKIFSRKSETEYQNILERDVKQQKLNTKATCNVPLIGNIQKRTIYRNRKEVNSG